MHFRALLLAAILVIPLSVSAEGFSLSASPGNYNPKTLGPSAKTAKLSASIRLVSFNGAQGWPPAAYVGFYQGPNRDRSVQFLVIRNRDSDPYVVAGYRVIEGGKEAKVESLANLPLESPAHVLMSFEAGQVTLRLNDRAPMLIRTSMEEVTPYASVSSGTAEFKVDP